ncbi:MAG: fibronectin type III domain-containing protein [bacterium]|nr:fibronectin type III domain-containing protein [bacterium]
MKIRIREIILALLLTLGIIPGLGTGYAGAGVNITFNGPAAASPGDIFWVTVDVDQVNSPLVSAHLNALEFNADLLEAKSVTNGGLTPASKGFSVISNINNNPNVWGKGYVNFLVIEGGASPIGVTGSGSIAKVKFQVRSGVGGTAKIDLTSAAQNCPPVCYIIRLKDSSGKEIPVDSVTPYSIQIMGPPLPPTTLTATTVSSSQIRLNWTDNSDNETGFVIERKPPGQGYNEAATVSANITTWLDTGLSSNTQYCYRVKARNAAGDSGYSNEPCATTQDVIPSNPTGLTATAKSTSRIDLSWNDLTNETGYAIQAKTATTSFADIDTVSANTTSYSHLGLSANTTYYYQVRAFNAIGVSGYSSTAQATTYDNPPAAPTGLVLSGVTANKIDLNWTDNSNNEAGFEIERKTETQPSYSLIDTVGAGATNSSNTGLASNTHYYYRVRAWSENISGDKNWSGYSSGADTTTLDIPPNAPSGLGATANSSSQITLNWSDNSTNETGFKIERRMAATFFAEIDTSSANVNQFIDTALLPNTTYYYQVRAYNGIGNSGYSNTAFATTFDIPPVAPGSLQAGAVSDSRIDLSWTDNSGNEDGFIIEKASSGSGPFSELNRVDTGITVYSHTGLTPKTTYCYRVKAYNGWGNSGPSNIACVTTNDTFPAAPSNLSLSDTGITQFRLNWTDNAANEAGFRIERKTTGGYSQIKEIPTPNMTTYLDTGLSPETTYTYRVRAYNGAGDSGYSNEASGTTLPSHFSLTVNSAYGSPSPGVGSDSYASGASVTASVSSPVSGPSGTRYVCTGRTGAGSVPVSGSDTNVTFNITQNSTITWQWRVEYQLLTAVNNPDWGGISPASGTWYETNSPATITATPKSGYTFSGWAGDLSGSTNPASLTMNGSKSVAANFTESSGVQCTLTVASAYGSPSPGVGTHSYNCGNSLTASVTSPVSGGDGIQYVCTGWTGTGFVPTGGTGTKVTFSLTQNSTITWNWKTQYYLTTSVEPAGGGTINIIPVSSSGWYDEGTSITLTAEPEGCNAFTGWTGALSGTTNPTSLTMDSPKAVTANFSGRRCHEADINCDDEIDDFELLDYIDLWVKGDVDDFSLLDAVDIWVAGYGACSNLVPTYASALAPVRALAPAYSAPLRRSPGEGSLDSQSVVSEETNPQPQWAPSNTQVTITRTLDCSQETTIDAALAVAVDESNKPNAIIIKEYIPAGWDEPSSTPPHDAFDSSTGEIRWLFRGSGGVIDRTITYQVQVGSGSKTFSGQVLYNDPAGTSITRDIGGDTSCEEEVTLTVISTHDSPFPDTAGSPHSYSPGTPVTASVTSPVSGGTGVRHVCTGWTGTGFVPATGTGTTVSFTINQNSSITWNWKTEYYLTTAVNPPGGGTVTPSSGWYESGQSVTLTAVPAPGYTFSGWSGDLSGITNPANLTMSAPKSVTANFNRPPAADAGPDQTVGSGVLVGLDGSSSSDPDGDPITYQWTQTSGPAVTLSNSTAQKPTFTPLTSGSCRFQLVVNDGQLNSAPDEVIITVTICVGQYTLTVSSAHDSPSPSTGTHCYSPGALITASVTSPVSGGTGVRHVCTGWTGTGSVPAGGTGTNANFTINQNSTITWHWKTEYYLTTSVNPAGAGTISPAAGWYEDGIVLPVNAIPVAGYAFTEWSGDLSGSNSAASLTMNGPKTITANFVPTQVITVSINAPAEVVYDSTFTATVDINQVGSLDNGYIKLNFDSNLFELISLDKGSLISKASVVSYLAGPWFYFYMSGSEVSGAGSLMEAEFKAIGPPSAVREIDIADISLGDAAGQAIEVGSVVGAEVEIKSPDDKPVPPGNLNLEVISLTRIDLNWLDNSNNEAGFQIERKKGSGIYNWLATVFSGKTSYSDSNLSPETTYCYRVRAYNNQGYSDWSNEKCATTTEVPPPAPTKLKATAGSSTRIDLTWDKNSANNERGFKIERSLSGGSAGFSGIGEVGVNVTVYHDEGLSPNTTYFYRVKAWNNQGNSPYSNEASATTPGETVLKVTAPETVAVRAGFEAVVEVTGVHDLSQCFFRVSFDPGIFRLISTVAGALISSTNPTISSNNASGKSSLWINIPGKVSGSGGLVKFGFEAIGAIGDSSKIEIDSITLADGAGKNIQVDSVLPARVTITGSPPASPANLTVTGFGQNSITLSWKDNSYNETGFILERKTSSYSVIAILPANITTYTDSGLSLNTFYYYRVKAYNDFGESAYSNEITLDCCRFSPDPPTDLAADIVSGSEVDLNWSDNSDNETGFKIERSISGGPYSEIRVVSANVTGYRDSGLSPCIYSYSYRVKAYNEVAASNYSNEITLPAQSPPESPSGLTGEGILSTRINLSWWDNSDNESGYKIERSQNGSGFTQVGMVGTNVTAYQDAGLNPKVTYCYRVRAENACGESNHTNEVCLTTGVTVKVVAPATVSYKNTFEVSIEVTQVTNLDTLLFKLEFNPAVLQVVPPVKKGTLTSTVVKPIDSIQNEQGWLKAVFNLPGTVGVSGAGSVAVIEFEAIGTNGAVSDLKLPEFNMGDNVPNQIPVGEIIPARVQVIGGPPSPPYNLKATAVSETQIGLTWQSALGDKIGFIIERRKAGETFVELTRVAANVTGYNDLNLESETTYYYRVRAYNTYGESGPSNESWATPPGPLSPPDNLSADTVSSTQIRLNWRDNANNETGFKIERRKKGSNTWTQIGTASANVMTYLDSGLEAETTYYYRVRAYDQSRDSGYSNEASATTPGSPPAAPDNLRGQEVLHNRIKIAWRDKSDNETGFKIERRIGSAGSFEPIGTVGAGVIAFQDTGLNPQTSYSYRVRAYNQWGDSGYSNIISLQTPLPPPEAPSDLVAEAISSSRIDLSWQDNSLDEDGFKIERRVGPDGNWVPIDRVPVNVSRYHDVDVSPLTTYYYRVRACNDEGGDSGYSNTLEIRTPPALQPFPVKLVFASDRTGDYEIYLMDDNGGAVTKLTDTPGIDWQPVLSPKKGVTQVAFVSDREGNSDIYLIGAGGGNLTRLTDDPAEDVEPSFSPDGAQIVFSSNREGDYKIYLLDVNDTESPVQLTQNTAGDRSPSFSPDGKQIVFVSDGDIYIMTMDVSGNKVSQLTNDPADDSQPCFSPNGLRIAFSSNRSGNDEIYLMDSNGENLENITKDPAANDFDPSFSPSPGDNRIAFTTDRDGNQEIYLINIDAEGQPDNLTNHLARDVHPSFGPALLPFSPSKLSIQTVGEGRIELTWQDRSTNEDGFVIERRVDGLSYSEIATVDAGDTTYIDSVVPGTDYCYQIRARNEYGSSEPSNEVCLSECCLAPIPPADLSAEIVSGPKIKLTWDDKSDNETGFKLERRVAGSVYPDKPLATLGPNVTTYYDSDFELGIDYCYQVRAGNGQGESNPSNEVQAKVDLPGPTGLSAGIIAAGQVKLTWQDNSEEEDGFAIERKTGGGSYTERARVGQDVTTYQDSGLDQDGIYYYRVRAYINNLGKSDYSNELKVEPTPKGIIVYPNPFFYKQHSRIIFEGDISAGDKIWIYTLAGGLVQTLSINGSLPDNDGDGQKFTWDNPTNENGERLASGIYLYILKSSRGKAGGKFAVVY